jgi:hypothetical protein
MKMIFTLCLLVQTAFTLSAQTSLSTKLQRYNGGNTVSKTSNSNNIGDASVNNLTQNITNAVAATYCTPTHTKNDKSNQIIRVDFAGTLNDVTNSSNSNVGYEDFTSLTSRAKQEQGEALIITGKIIYEKGSSNSVLLSSNTKAGVYNLQLISTDGIVITTAKLIVAN